MARITRKELKTDPFALQIEHTVTIFEEHRKEILRYGAVAVAAAVLIFGYTIYHRRQHAAQDSILATAIQVQETPVGPPTPGSPSTNSFPTQQAKDDVALKTFADVKSKYPGSDAAEVAEYYMGSIRADQGNLAEAEKSFQEVAQKGDEKYASLAKLSLAQIYFGQGKSDQAQKLLQDLIAHPTIFVSKEQASLTLASGLLPTKPAEARKILDQLRNQAGAVSQAAMNLYRDLPPQ